MTIALKHKGVRLLDGRVPNYLFQKTKFMKFGNILYVFLCIALKTFPVNPISIMLKRCSMYTIKSKRTTLIILDFLWVLGSSYVWNKFSDFSNNFWWDLGSQREIQYYTLYVLNDSESVNFHSLQVNHLLNQPCLTLIIKIYVLNHYCT